MSKQAKNNNLFAKKLIYIMPTKSVLIFFFLIISGCNFQSHHNFRYINAEIIGGEYPEFVNKIQRYLSKDNPSPEFFFKINDIDFSQREVKFDIDGSATSLKSTYKIDIIFFDKNKKQIRSFSIQESTVTKKSESTIINRQKEEQLKKYFEERIIKRLVIMLERGNENQI